MEYQVLGESMAHSNATFSVRNNSISFGIDAEENILPNPAELLLGAFSACCLKNINRFSKLLKFDYENAHIEVIGTRQNTPTKMTDIRYIIRIKSNDSRINTELLHKNITKHGTIYNTLKETCHITGEIKII